MLGQSKSKPLHRVAVKRQKDTAAKLLFKLWLGVLFVSCALTVGLLWLQTQDAEEVVLKTGLTPNRLFVGRRHGCVSAFLWCHYDVFELCSPHSK